MDVRIKTTQYEMTTETSDYLDNRLAYIERLVSDDEAACLEVELGRHTGHPKHSDDHWFVEINIITKGNRFRAVTHATSINAAIDEAKDEIVRTIRTDQRLHRRLLRKGSGIIKQALKFGRE